MKVRMDGREDRKGRKERDMAGMDGYSTAFALVIAATMDGRTDGRTEG